ncbi:hypothetical protein CY35_07G074300 [Sphagnum magellanicum]|uniref:Uncharacterized protein n=1 Tax=Sphagnum magellanicum TaxID=128215 RepID=A0ACB8HLW6_9BRYO|nr:hypothetical protein CY35_07G074300 [Sphagnum magellanicum]
MSHAEGQGNGGKAAADADPITNSRGGNDLESHLLPEDSAEEQVADEAPLLENRPPTPPTDSLLFVCTVFSIVSALGSVLCMVVNLISLLRSFDYRGFDYRVSPFILILRCYAVAMAFFVALAETEWEAIFRLWQVLEYWVGRGMFQIFVAVLTNVLAQASGETQAESVLHEVASWWLLICGIIYTAAGLLCIGRIKHSHLRAVHRRQQAIKDLEEVHRQRAELEAQLGHQ